MTNSKQQIQILRSSKNTDDRKLCIKLLSDYLSENPTDTEAWFDLGSCHDFLGEEQLAEPAYARALALGADQLPVDKQPRLFLQYGSTLRNNSKFQKAKDVLAQGLKKFPDDSSLKIFAALNLYSAGEYQDCSRLLFQICQGLPSELVNGYDRAVAHYVDHLDHV